MRDLISVIVPVYNAERYLDECIAGIIGQSYADFELILINDGSSDSSGEICRRHAGKDSRIIVIDKPNGGVSAARNTALDTARGKWIIFSDADDYYLPGAFEKLISAATSAPDIDMAVGSHLRLENGKTSYPATQKADMSRSAMSAMTHFALWGYIFRKDIIDRYSIRFDTSLALSEDRLFMAEFAIKARAIAMIPDPVYVYRIHQASACRRAKDIVKASRMQFEAIEKMYLLKNQVSKSSDAEAIERFCKEIVQAVITMAAFESSDIRKLLTVKKMAQECSVKYDSGIPFIIFCAYTRLRKLSRILRGKIMKY